MLFRTIQKVIALEMGIENDDTTVVRQTLLFKHLQVLTKGTAMTLKLCLHVSKEKRCKSLLYLLHQFYPYLGNKLRYKELQFLLFSQDPLRFLRDLTKGLTSRKKNEH